MSSNPKFESFSCSANDGLMLGGRLYGKANRKHPPVVCLAGLSRNCLDFHELALHLSSRKGGSHRVLALDYRGRGLSQYDKNWRNYTIFQESDDVISAITAAGFSHVNVIGTSRGGLIAMLLGAMRPGILNSVILNDIGPVLEAEGLFRILTSLDQLKNAGSWDEVEAEFIRVGELQFPDLTKEQWCEQSRNVFEMKDGVVTPRYDPNIANTLHAIDFDMTIPDMWPQFASLNKIPLMTIYGEYSDLLSIDTLGMMRTLNPDMKVKIVIGQGHAPGLHTAGLPETIANFFATVSKSK